MDHAVGERHAAHEKRQRLRPLLPQPPSANQHIGREQNAAGECRQRNHHLRGFGRQDEPVSHGNGREVSRQAPVSAASSSHTAAFMQSAGRMPFASRCGIEESISASPAVGGDFPDTASRKRAKIPQSIAANEHAARHRRFAPAANKVYAHSAAFPRTQVVGQIRAATAKALAKRTNCKGRICRSRGPSKPHQDRRSRRTPRARRVARATTRA